MWRSHCPPQLRLLHILHLTLQLLQLPQHQQLLFVVVMSQVLQAQFNHLDGQKPIQLESITVAGLLIVETKEGRYLEARLAVRSHSRVGVSEPGQ